MHNTTKNYSPQLIEGDTFVDERGTLAFVNAFDMRDVKRMYTITHPNTHIVRAWQGHKTETKYFKCIHGRFLIALVKIDDWAQPSADLIAETFVLDAIKPQVLQVPKGYANGFKALDAGSQLLVFSDQTLEAAQDDQFRFSSDFWFHWT
ncbi:WxcM-like domain-containing protein [Lacinutrix undariae]